MKLHIFVQADLLFRSCWTTSRSTRCAPSPPWRRPAAFAPARLHRVQSAVSHAIANLEAQLRVTLFDRSVYKPALTPAGQALLADVRIILAKVDALRAHAHELGEGVELGLSLAVDTLFPPDAVAHALKAMHARYPSVGVRVEYASLGGPAQALKARRCTLAVAVLERPDDQIRRRFLAPVTTWAVAAPGHPLARGEAGTELADHLQVVVEDLSAATRGRDYGVLSPRTWRVGDMVTKLALLRAGVGWGSLPAWLVQADLRAGTLVRLPLAELGPDGAVQMRAYLSHCADEPLGPAGGRAACATACAKARRRCAADAASAAPAGVYISHGDAGMMPAAIRLPAQGGPRGPRVPHHVPAFRIGAVARQPMAQRRRRHARSGAPSPGRRRGRLRMARQRCRYRRGRAVLGLSGHRSQHHPARGRWRAHALGRRHARPLARRGAAAVRLRRRTCHRRDLAGRTVARLQCHDAARPLARRGARATRPGRAGAGAGVVWRAAAGAIHATPLGGEGGLIAVRLLEAGATAVAPAA
ncbi:LysR substrate-binding domain protein [Bordetella pertussis CHLA-20]|nr:LysR substrate-binding domain protein [Bordetella pertussis CHLA-20]